MFQNKLSIICPVYNAEKYIEQCIQSILSQQFQDFELILINDGSSDNSLNICNQYAQKNPQIKVINKHNEGVSIARNIGLKNANGEYIIFIDADDALCSPYALNIIMDVEYKYSPDIVNFQSTSADYQQIKISSTPNIENQTIKDYTKSTNNYNTVWGFLFHSEIIKKYNIQFPNKIKYGEDQEFIGKYLLFCSQITIIKEPLYFYRITQESAMGKGIPIQEFDTFKRIIRFNQYYLNHKQYSNKQVFEQIINKWLNNGFSYLWTYPFTKEKFSIINQQFKSCYKILHSLNISKTLLRLGYIDIRIATIYNKANLFLNQKRHE